jgi:hypothetical protein
VKPGRRQPEDPNQMSCSGVPQTTVQVSVSPAKILV